MGIGDFIDTIGNALDDAGQGIEHLAGDAVPATPSFSQRMLDDAKDALTAGLVETEHFGGGVVKGVGDVVKFVRGINPVDPYNMTHPADYIDHLSQTAAGIVHTALHPQELVTGLVGTGWSSDPAEALGHLIPNIAATFATDGAGAAEDTGVAASSATEEAATATRTVAEADPDPGLADPPPAEPDSSWGDFGPTGLQDADSAVADNLNSADSGLDNFDHDLSGVHAHAESTTTSSAYDGTTPSAVHTPPRLADPSPASPSPIQTRLNGLTEPPSLDTADAAAAHDITDAGNGLGKAEQDLSEIGKPKTPAGPQANNPDYEASQYEAGPGARKAFDDKYPPNSYARRIVDDIRAQHPETTKSLTYQDVWGSKRMTMRDHAYVNEALRTGDQEALADLDPLIRNSVSGLNKLPDYAGGPVFRGIQIAPQDLDSVLETYTPGETVTEPAFTHADKVTPHSGNVQFTISDGPGKDVSFLQTQLLDSEKLCIHRELNFR